MEFLNFILTRAREFTLYFRNLIKRLLKVRISLGLVFVICVLFWVFVWGLFDFSFKFAAGNARVIGVGVGVYWDSNCDNAIVSLSWGKFVVNPMRISESKNVTVYVRNEGTEPIILFLNTYDLDPPFLRNYINLSWDYDGRFLESGEVMKVNLILSINSSIWWESIQAQKYSFNIKISALYLDS